NQMLWPRLQVSQHRSPALNPIPPLDVQLGRRIEQNIRTRPKFDQANTLTALHTITDLLGEHDPAREESRNLFEDNRVALPLYRDHVLLIQVGAGLIHGIAELAMLIPDILNYACDWRSIDVHVEDVEENADSGTWLAIDSNGRELGHLAIGRGDQRSFSIRNDALRIAEKPKKKGSKQQAGYCPEGGRQPSHQHCCCQQQTAVIIPISHHGEQGRL